MIASLHYVLASFGLGLITFFGSENLFWSAPMPGITLQEIGLTIIAYSVCCAAGLSAVLWSGIRGWPALFLGGAIVGWLVEGVIVGTTYDFFPIYLIWTPLAWHALVTGLCIVGLCRAGVHWPEGQQMAGLVGLGLFAAYFAQFWPLERGAMPSFSDVLSYVFGLSVVVPLGNLALDRAGPLKMPPRLVLLVAPGALAALWAVQTMASMNILRLSVPLLIALTIWVMRRLAPPPALATDLDFGAPAPLWRHGLFLIAPLISSVLSVLGWAVLQGHSANIPVALGCGALALFLWGLLLVRAMRIASPA